MNRARNWQEFTKALSRFPGPAQNFVYGDVDGNIGYHATGKLPIRKGYAGDVPVDGASGNFEWQGFIPFDQLPASFNPPDGLIVTANQNPFPPDYPYAVHGNFASALPLETDPRHAFGKEGLAARRHAGGAEGRVLRLQPLSGASGGDGVRPARTDPRISPTPSLCCARGTARWTKGRPEPLIAVARVSALSQGRGGSRVARQRARFTKHRWHPR